MTSNFGLSQFGANNVYGNMNFESSVLLNGLSGNVGDLFVSQGNLPPLWLAPSVATTPTLAQVLNVGADADDIGITNCPSVDSTGTLNLTSVSTLTLDASDLVLNSANDTLIDSTGTVSIVSDKFTISNNQWRSDINTQAQWDAIQPPSFGAVFQIGTQSGVSPFPNGAPLNLGTLPTSFQKFTLFNNSGSNIYVNANTAQFYVYNSGGANILVTLQILGPNDSIDIYSGQYNDNTVWFGRRFLA